MQTTDILPPPIAPALFVGEDVAPGSAQLLGGRHRDSGALVFPLPDDDAYAAEPLSREGTLWSFTVQRFRPKSPPYRGPERFEPFALGYVELPDGIIIETRLTGDPGMLKIGMPVRLTTEVLPVGPENAPRTSYAFEPCAGAR